MKLKLNQWGRYLGLSLKRWLTQLTYKFLKFAYQFSHVTYFFKSWYLGDIFMYTSSFKSLLRKTLLTSNWNKCHVCNNNCKNKLYDFSSCTTLGHQSSFILFHRFIWIILYFVCPKEYWIWIEYCLPIIQHHPLFREMSCLVMICQFVNRGTDHDIMLVGKRKRIICHIIKD